MKTIDVLNGIRKSLVNNPDLISNIEYKDIFELIYLDIQCRRQLYPASQMKDVDLFFDMKLKEISTAIERRNAMLLDRMIEEIAGYISVLPDAEFVSDFIEQSNMDHLKLEHILNNTIFVIGDSHVNIFSGNEELAFIPIGRGINTARQISDLPFSVFHMGPCLAYNSNRYNTTCRFREKLDYLLDDVVEDGAKIMFVLGWIDLRAHVFKQSIINSCSYETVVDNILTNYIGMMTDVSKAGYEVCCFGPIGTLSEETPTEDKFVNSGTEIERNLATGYFTKKLRKMCDDEGIVFASILDRLIKDDGHTDIGLLCSDGCHLGKESLPLIINELKRAGIMRDR